MTKLSVVGLGLRCPEQTSQRCLEAIRQADRVFLISDNLEKQDWLRQLNPNFYNLMTHYGTGKPRRDTYQEMADQVLDCLRAGQHAALVSYGHPLVFCDPSRLAIEQTAQAGYPMEILPGVSSIDCLLADLRVDAQNYGLQIYEGHDLLLHGLVLDPSCSQIVFQVPSLGDNTGGWIPGRFRGFIRALGERLIEVFGPEHEAVLYFGSNSPERPTRADRCRLAELHEAEMISEYTLWVPPLGYQSLPPDLRPRDQGVELELVGSGPRWADRTRETDELLTSHQIYSLQPLPELPQARVVASLTELDQDSQPKVVFFPAHPCNSGAVEWARQAEAAGLSYRIRPAISWEDGIYCDVPLDPGLLGFQSFPPGAMPPEPVNLATMLRLPGPPRPQAQYWGPQSGFSEQAASDSLALYLPGPSPRPLENAPFLRALHWSAVERLVSFLEMHEDRLVLQKNPSARLWLHAHLQLAGREIREALAKTDLSTLAPDGNWSLYLLDHPEHPAAPYLLLRMRCEEALESSAKGVSLEPLAHWIKARR
ncbi:MAG: SAM-dependent methyltransferase [Vulcanimicrobiota bacterium]